jgi:hypothetical protein
MAYTINKTDGSVLATVADGQIDQGSTSLTLIGKNFSGFGDYLNENLVHLLENFSGQAQPSPAITGQLWYDTSENRIKVYSGTEWKSVGTSALAVSRPLDISTGDFWFNTVDSQLYFFDGSRDFLIGPDYSTAQGLSGLRIETYEDAARRNRTVATLYVGTVIVGFFSATEFTLRFPIPNYNVVDTITGTTTPNLVIRAGFNPIAESFKFRGTADNADKLGSVDFGLYARRDITVTFNDIVQIASNDSLKFGNGFVGNIGVVNQGDVFIANTANNKRVFIAVNKNNTNLTMLNIVPSELGEDQVLIAPNNINSLTTVGGQLLVKGNLTVEGATTFIAAETITLSDKNIELAAPSSGSPTDTLADGGGLILKGSTDHSMLWDETTGDWNFTENIDIPALRSYKINGVPVLEDTGAGIRLTTAVTSAPGLNQFGAQINSTIDNITINNNRISNNGRTLQYFDGDSAVPNNIVIEPLGNILLEGTPNPLIIGASTTSEDSINHETESSSIKSATELSQVTTKKYVTNFVRTRNIPLTLDITGAYPNQETAISASDVVSILNNIAPPVEYDSGTKCRISTYRYFVENIREVATTGSHYSNGSGLLTTTTLNGVSGSETLGGPTIQTGVVREVTSVSIPTQLPPQLYIVRGYWEFELTIIGSTLVWQQAGSGLVESTPTPAMAGIASFVRPTY